VIQARPAGLGHDLATIVGRALRAVPRDPAGVIPPALERKLADARERGWDRGIERHQRIADRIGTRLIELGEPCGPPEDTP
jgi:hypothetical protein